MTPAGGGLNPVEIDGPVEISVRQCRPQRDGVLDGSGIRQGNMLSVVTYLA